MYNKASSRNPSQKQYTTSLTYTKRNKSLNHLDLQKAMVGSHIITAFLKVLRLGLGQAEACHYEFCGRAHCYNSSSSKSSASQTKRGVNRLNSSQVLIGPQKP